MRPRTVCISFPPLPARARRLDDEELSRIFGGCRGHREFCDNLIGGDKACCPPYECDCIFRSACRCYKHYSQDGRDYIS